MQQTGEDDLAHPQMNIQIWNSNIPVSMDMEHRKHTKRNACFLDTHKNMQDIDSPKTMSGTTSQLQTETGVDDANSKKQECPIDAHKKVYSMQSLLVQREAVRWSFFRKT